MPLPKSYTARKRAFTLAFSWRISSTFSTPSSMKDSAPIWMAIVFFWLPGADACCAELLVAVVVARPATAERKKSLRSIFPPPWGPWLPQNSNTQNLNEYANKAEKIPRLCFPACGAGVERRRRPTYGRPACGRGKRDLNCVGEEARFGPFLRKTLS